MALRSYMKCKTCMLFVLIGSSRYQTLDNIDGKQARRTGTSSGLGELFEYVEQLKRRWWG